MPDRRGPRGRGAAALAGGELLGDTLGEKGLWTMDDSWFDEHVYQVVVRVSRLPQEVRDALGAEPVMLPSWDPMR